MNLGSATRTHVNHVSAEDEDRDLSLRFAQGDRGAFAVVVEQFGPRVTALAARLLGWREGADDVAQEVFLAAWHNQRRFRGESSLWTWLAAMTVNRSRSVQRRRRLFDKFAAAAGRAPAKAGLEPGPEQRLYRDETAACVREAVARLPVKYREVLVLRYLEELAVDEIAALLSERRNTIEVRITRARKLLEPQLAEVFRGEW